MYGHKQIMSCLLVVIFVAILNFYRSAIKREKEWKTIREKLKFESEQKIESMIDDHSDKVKESTNLNLLEYDNRCLAIHALLYRPMFMFSVNDQTNFTINKTINTTTGEFKQFPTVNPLTTPHHCDCDCSSTQSPSSPPSPPIETDRRKTSAEKESKKSVTNALSASSMIYLLVIILLISLAKAAFDLSKQYKKKSVETDDTDLMRRCSLQEYSLMKHRQQSSKSNRAFEPFLRRTAALNAMSQQRSLDGNAGSSGSRRTSNQSTDYSNGSGIPTEPGSPIKAGKLLAGRPIPLLRRCSVPVFAQNPNILCARRPSMDSVSEDDSQFAFNGGLTFGEGRRRVRMIQRH